MRKPDLKQAWLGFGGRGFPYCLIQRKIMPAVIPGENEQLVRLNEQMADMKVKPSRVAA